MTPEEQATILDKCEAHQKAHWQDRDYRAAIFIGTEYFVKFGHPSTLDTEVATQRYISEYATASSTLAVTGIPRIPSVLSYFTHENTAYIVSEYVMLADSPSDPKSIAAALKWLVEVPLPPNHIIGTLTGGPIRHHFLKDYEAPLDFSSIAALERYIEKGRTRLQKQRQEQVQAVRIIGESSVFMQADLDSSNFGRDERENTVIMDFSQIGPLPISFAAHTLHRNPQWV